SASPRPAPRPRTPTCRQTNDQLFHAQADVRGVSTRPCDPEPDRWRRAWRYATSVGPRDAISLAFASRLPRRKEHTGEAIARLEAIKRGSAALNNCQGQA